MDHYIKKLPVLVQQDSTVNPNPLGWAVYAFLTQHNTLPVPDFVHREADNLELIRAFPRLHQATNPPNPSQWLNIICQYLLVPILELSIHV